MYISIIFRWINTSMNESDIKQLMTFFQYLSATYPQTERFLNNY